MKKLLSILFISFIFSAEAIAETFEQFCESSTLFYMNPSKDRFLTLQKSADAFKDELEKQKTNAPMLTSIMFARISKKYSWPLASSAFAQQANEILEGKSELAQYVENDQVVDKDKLNIWWGSFFATGEEVYLTKLLNIATSQPKTGAENDLIVDLAQRQLKSNCFRQKKVLEFVKVKYANDIKSNTVPRFLNKCIKSNGI